MTAKSVQRQLGVDQPDYGVLFEDMQISDGGMLSAALLLQPKVEAVSPRQVFVASGVKVKAFLAT